MKLLVAGDFCPYFRVESIIEQGAIERVFDGIQHIIDDCDYRILNLECPLISDEKAVKPIMKHGPCLKASYKTASFLKAKGFDCVTLANNHFRDYGDEGISQTISLLRDEKIEYVGGGRTIEEVKRVLYKSINNETFAIINACEHEFSIADESSFGSNPLCVTSIYRDIQDAKTKTKNIIVIVHGGHELYQLPSPRMKDVYHFFIDVGASCVINHHQHCYSGFEEYNGGVIFYGLGDFCFDIPNQNPVCYEGYMVELTFTQNSKWSYKIIPYVQCEGEPVIRPMTRHEELMFSETIHSLNTIISSDALLHSSFEEYAHKNESRIRFLMAPYSNRFLRKLCSMHLLPAFLTPKRACYVLNQVSCEAHRDLLTNMLTHYINK